jgi:hypothetical protein
VTSETEKEEEKEVDAPSGAGEGIGRKRACESPTHVEVVSHAARR